MFKRLNSHTISIKSILTAFVTISTKRSIQEINCIDLGQGLTSRYIKLLRFRKDIHSSVPCLGQSESGEIFHNRHLEDEIEML